MIGGQKGSRLWITALGRVPHRMVPRIFKYHGCRALSLHPQMREAVIISAKSRIVVRVLDRLHTVVLSIRRPHETYVAQQPQHRTAWRSAIATKSINDICGKLSAFVAPPGCGDELRTSKTSAH